MNNFNGILPKRSFRFSKVYFKANGVSNIPGLIISTGFGYAFKTYCCSNCGEIYAVNLEDVSFRESGLEVMISNIVCQECKKDLRANLVEYPQHVFYNGSLHKTSAYSDDPIPGTTILKEIYTIN